MKIKRYTCQECGSQNTQKCAMAYQQGVSTGFRGETSISDIAKRAAPPTDPGLLKSKLILVMCLIAAPILLLIAISSFIYGGISIVPIGALAMAGYSLYLIVNTVKYLKLGPVMKQNYQRDLDLYERLWICRDCGHIYEVQDSR